MHLLTISKLSLSVNITGDPYRKKLQRCPKTQPDTSRSPPSGAPQTSCGRNRTDPRLTRPAKDTGRPRANQRAALHVIIFRMRSGCQWNHLPKEEFPDD